MHPSDSLFTGVKRVDYRNARYEGLIHSTSSRRHGFGILLDDDMNLYCSQWDNGRLSGSTFLALSSGHFFYGIWKNNEPNGLNIYRSRQFIVLGCYLRGQNIGNTIAITQTLSHLLVFQGIQISFQERKEPIELVNHEAITQISLFQEIVLSSAAKFGLRLDKSELSPASYLQKIAEKYSNLSIKFIEEGDCKYFGFHNGLGFRFNLQGKVYHKIKMLSIGSFEDQRITDYGVKFHVNRCVEEGNFLLKQTITYNKWVERPRQKCLAISQKTHKKGLHFLNEYFQFKGQIIADLQSSLQARLWPKLQQIIKYQFQLRRQPKQKPSIPKEPSKSLIKNHGKNKKMQSRSPMKKNSSTVTIKHSPIKNSPDKHQQRVVKHRKLTELQKYQEIQKQLQDFHRPIPCDRCWSKQRKRSILKKGAQSKSKQKKAQSKSKQKKELSRSPLKLAKPKQIKYLADYHRKIPNEESNEADNSHNTKSFTNLAKKSQDKDKELRRVVNERKIREEILSRERDLQLRREAMISEYPRNFNEFVGTFPSEIQNYVPFNSNSIPRMQSAYELLNSKPQYHFQRNQSKDVRYNDEDAQSRRRHDNFEELESRRDRILKQFKALNNISPSSNFQTKNRSLFKAPSLNLHQPHLIQNEGLKPKGGRQQIENFNKKYRNYLNNQSDTKDKQKLRRQALKERQAPIVSSFGYSPSRFQKDKNQQRQLGSGFKGYLDGNKKRYEYFFDVGQHTQF